MWFIYQDQGVFFLVRFLVLFHITCDRMVLFQLNLSCRILRLFLFSCLEDSKSLNLEICLFQANEVTN